MNGRDRDTEHKVLQMDMDKKIDSEKKKKSSLAFYIR